MDLPEVRYQKSDDVGEAGTIITSGRVKILKEIEIILNNKGSQQLVGRFINRHFGHFLAWKPGLINSEVLHGIVSRAVIDDRGLWFYIKGSYIEYSIADHALVTDLKFGRLNYNPTVARDPINSNFARTVCNGYPEKGKDLVQVFKQLRNTHDDPDGKIHLCLAQLLVTNMFVFGHDAGREPYPWLWELSENPDIFNNFPWGAYSYKTLKHYVENASGGSKYHLYGPAWALVVWAFEVVPQLAAVAATRDTDNDIPRCLKWIFKKKLRVTNVELRALFEEEGEVPQNIVATDEETVQPYFTSIDQRALDVQFEIPPNLLAQRVQLPAEVRLRRVRRASPPPPPPLPLPQHVVDEILASVLERETVKALLAAPDGVPAIA